MGSVRDYFDRHAPFWDGYQRAEDAPVIEKILDRAGICAADDVLDVACGTGVLTPFLARRAPRSLSAVDISPEMTAIYRRKFPGLPVATGDYEARLFPAGAFSAVIIFNAFPHFGAPAAVMSNSFFCLKPGGRLVVAHSMRRAALDEHHRRAGMEVRGHVLASDDEFRRLYAGAGFADVTVDDGEYFYSAGSRPA